MKYVLDYDGKMMLADMYCLKAAIVKGLSKEDPSRVLRDPLLTNLYRPDFPHMLQSEHFSTD